MSRAISRSVVSWKMTYGGTPRVRATCRRIARKRGVPPYVIFHDTTLREIARTKPTTMDALRHIYGVGARKADDLGEMVIAEVQAPA